MATENRTKSAPEELAEYTGRDADEFSADEYEIPHPEELETVPVDDQ